MEAALKASISLLQLHAPNPRLRGSAPPLPRALPFTGAGRGVPRMQQPPVDKPPEENRFIRRREAAKQAAAGPPSAPGPQQPKLSGPEAVKRALELLGGGGGGRGGRSDEDGGGRGGGGRSFRGRGGRGRGMRRGGRTRDDGRSVDVGDRQAIYLGDNADGERLEKKLGVDKMKILEQAFMEAADNALPHPIEDAYLDACHTNNMVRVAQQWILPSFPIWMCLRSSLLLLLLWVCACRSSLNHSTM